MLRRSHGLPQYCTTSGCGRSLQGYTIFINMKACLKACWRSKLLEKHVNESYGDNGSVACAPASSRQGRGRLITSRALTRNQRTPKHSERQLQGMKKWRCSRVPFVNRVEMEVFACSFCERSLPSQQGLRNHERRWHQGQVSTLLAQRPMNAKKKRERWSEEDLKRPYF